MQRTLRTLWSWVSSLSYVPFSIITQGFLSYIWPLSTRTRGQEIQLLRAPSTQFIDLSAELQERPLRSLHIAELIAFGATSPVHMRAVADHIDHTIHQIFRLFDLQSPDLFRLLHATGSVISGSAALLALLPWTFEPADLDIYVPRSQTNFVIKVIRDMHGFELYRSATPSRYRGNPAVGGIFWFRKNHITLNVIASTSDNALEPIFHFHSTVVMNFISSLGVFCAYPNMTLNRRGLVNADVHLRGQSEETISRCFDKYRSRGFTINTTLNDWEDMDGHRCTQDPSCPHTLRSVYDRGGLFYRFRRRSWMGTRTKLRIHGAITSSVWSLGANKCSNIQPTVRVSSSASLLEIDESEEQQR